MRNLDVESASMVVCCIFTVLVAVMLNSAMAVLPPAPPGYVPFYEYYNTREGARAYRASPPGGNAWHNLGIAFRAYTNQVGATVQIYEYYSSGLDYEYTTRNTPFDSSWAYFGISFYAFSDAAAGTVPIWQYYSSIDLKHIYTSNTALTLNGFRNDGITFHALPAVNVIPSHTTTSHGQSQVTVLATTTFTTSPPVVTTIVTLHAVATTSTTITASSVEGIMILKITNATQFINEANMLSVVTIALVEIFKVNASWVQNVTVIPVWLDGRLLPNDDHTPAVTMRMHGRNLNSVAPGAHLTTKSGARIQFSVVIPPDGMAQVTATVLARRFNFATLEEVSDIVNRIVKSGVLGQFYDAVVTYKYAIAPQTLVAPPPSPGKAETGTRFQVPFLVFSLVAFVVCFLTLGAICLWLRRRGKKAEHALRGDGALAECKRASDVAEWSVSEFLCPPDTICTWWKSSLDKYWCILFARAEAQVYVTFAMDGRENDVADTGPGLFYAAAVGKTLLAHGVPCCASLRHVSLAMWQDDAAALLAHPSNKIQVLIVVEACALYESESCLREIYAALENNVEVIRLRFEIIPDEYERWPQINLLNEDIRYEIGFRTVSLKEMKMLVLQKLDVISPPPPPLLVQKNSLESFAVGVHSKLMGRQPSVLMGIASKGTAFTFDTGKSAKVSSVLGNVQGRNLELRNPFCKEDASDIPTTSDTRRLTATRLQGGERPCECSKEYDRRRHRATARPRNRSFSFGNGTNQKLVKASNLADKKKGNMRDIQFVKNCKSLAQIDCNFVTCGATVPTRIGHALKGTGPQSGMQLLNTESHKDLPPSEPVPRFTPKANIRNNTTRYISPTSGSNPKRIGRASWDERRQATDGTQLSNTRNVRMHASAGLFTTKAPKASMRDKTQRNVVTGGGTSPACVCSPSIEAHVQGSSGSPVLNAESFKYVANANLASKKKRATAGRRCKQKHGDEKMRTNTSPGRRRSKSEKIT